MKRSPGTYGRILGGLLVALGGWILRPEPATTSTELLELEPGSQFWFAFVVGGLLIGIIGVAVNVANRTVRMATLGLLAGLIILALVVLGEIRFDADDVLGYGFVAGGLIVSVAVMFTDVLRHPNR